MANRPWLTLLGVGEDGRASLSPAANHLLSQARIVFGGARHLALIGDHPGDKRPWPSPFAQAVPEVLALRGQEVCVLASGDPFFYGVGSLLSAVLAPEEMLCLPAPSSVSLAAARLGWAQQDCETISLHGRPLERIIPLLRPGARILALAWDGETPGKLAALLTQRGFGASRLTVLEALGGPRETVSTHAASEIARRQFDALNVIAVAVAGTGRCLPRAPGLPDDWFEHDGQITKRDIRALTLSALAPRPGGLLWDIGAGSGSIGIEWMLADARNRAVAIEPRPDRAARIARNAVAFGVPDLAIITGSAPDALHDLPPPDAIFVGGGGPEVMEAACAALPLGARLVINGVTLESQAKLTELHHRYGGELSLIQIAKAAPLGDYSGWQPARPIVQWGWERGV